ncbi:MAG: hypothetical protein AVDCRST_MAG48-987, partial [uncultured Friedmanniella sp.]
GAHGHHHAPRVRGRPARGLRHADRRPVPRRGVPGHRVEQLRRRRRRLHHPHHPLVPGARGGGPLRRRHAHGDRADGLGRGRSGRRAHRGPGDDRQGPARRHEGPAVAGPGRRWHRRPADRRPQGVHPAAGQEARAVLGAGSAGRLRQAAGGRQPLAGAM